MNERRHRPSRVGKQTGSDGAVLKPGSERGAVKVDIGVNYAPPAAAASSIQTDPVHSSSPSRSRTEPRHSAQRLGNKSNPGYQRLSPGWTRDLSSMLEFKKNNVRVNERREDAEKRAPK